MGFWETLILIGVFTKYWSPVKGFFIWIGGYVFVGVLLLIIGIIVEALKEIPEVCFVCFVFCIIFKLGEIQNSYEHNKRHNKPQHDIKLTKFDIWFNKNGIRLIYLFGFVSFICMFMSGSGWLFVFAWVFSLILLTISAIVYGNVSNRVSVFNLKQ